MKEARAEAMRRSLALVAGDAFDDANKLDGMPFDGLSVGANFGNVYASIASIAEALAEVVGDLPAEVPEDERLAPVRLAAVRALVGRAIDRPGHPCLGLAREILEVIDGA